MPSLRNRSRRVVERARDPEGPLAVHWHLNVAAFAVAVAIAAYAVAVSLGRVHGHHHGTVHQKVILAISSAVFVVAGIVATRATANEVYTVVGSRTAPGHAGMLRWFVTIFGYIVVVTAAFGVLDVPLGQLVLGGALTGVILGIAAQQSLGNIFAGVVLLVARPFTVGDAIRVKAGALGGELTGQVTAMGITYATLLTPEGPLSIPNSAMLAAAVGPMVPQPVAAPVPAAPTDPPEPDQVFDSGAGAEQGFGQAQP